MEYFEAGAHYFVERDGREIPTTCRTGPSLVGGGVAFPSQKDRLAARYAEREADDEPLCILDIGCGGCGYHTLFEETAEEQLQAAGYEDPEVAVVGVDLNVPALQDVINGSFSYFSYLGRIDDARFKPDEDGYCRMRADERNRLQPVGGDAARLPFADDTFDMVYSNVALIWVPDEDIPDVLTEADRVLADGGIDALETLGRQDPNSFRDGQ